MKKALVVMSTAVALAFTAGAARMVSMDEAVWAALGWADGADGQAAGFSRKRVGRVEPCLTAASNRCYIVEFEGEGAVMMSAYTWTQAMIAFTNTTDFAAVVSDADLIAAASSVIDGVNPDEIYDDNPVVVEWTGLMSAGAARDVVTGAADEEWADFDSAFTNCSSAVVLRGAGKMTREVVVSNDLTIVGEDHARVSVRPGMTFRIVDGARLCVSNVVFDGFAERDEKVRYGGEGLFVIEGGSLSLGCGTELYNLRGTHQYSGAIAIRNGRGEIGEGVRIESCQAYGTRSIPAYNDSFGGAVYVSDQATLDMRGGVIVNCHAKTSGGGIYIYEKGRVVLGGAVRIIGNGRLPQVDGDRNDPDDVYVPYVSGNGRLEALLIGDRGLGSATIGYRCDFGGHRNVGEPFLDVSNLTSNQAERAARCFVNDTYPLSYEIDDEEDNPDREVMAVYDPVAKMLKWEWWEWREPLAEEPPEEPVIPDEAPYTMSLIAFR